MPSPLIHNANNKSLPYNRYLKAMIFAMATSVAVVGCDSNSDSNPEALVQVFENEVKVDNSLVQTSTPERYQPSYNLEGALIPVDNVDVTTPYPVLSASIEVKEGDKVEQGQVLAKVESKVSESKLPFISNKFLEVYVDGVQINGSKNTPSSTSDTSSTSKQEEKLVPVTLVLKSPISGSITKIFDPSQTNEDGSVAKDDQDNNAQNSAQGNKDRNEAKKSQSVENKGIESKDENNESDESRKPNSDQDNPSSPVITVANPKKLQLIGKLPLSTQSQLSVGKPVYFTVHDLQKEFTGQISNISPDPESDTLMVHAPLVAGENSKALLKPGMQASMSIEYGQIELGVRLPRSAIHEAKLDGLTKKRPRPNSPIKGYVWVVDQAQKLVYTPIEVVQYFADSDQFLVSGISNESLVCLADLPRNSDGKTLSVH
ncbi:HlyD family efflux transporter periplasmic adaptor subunit [Psychrobacter phenylpyruvicus]|uniref:Efflux transporter, RND family, MFP subunit n=1 Tax=Psychrobacter phenylpyruvicus TaxID=29432 RepID=A0A379LNF0_9GAMM|nr:HlyD family efflux transporter periplasmic adaptor subunit [Psychrobacter phenylpyruvicus]SUD92119.1 efflux transporter, RND family, MFP subunit [Psychrobacter phenylpyruvicus]